MNWMNTNWKALLVILAAGYLGWTVYNGVIDNARAANSYSRRGIKVPMPPMPPRPPKVYGDY